MPRGAIGPSFSKILEFRLNFTDIVPRGPIDNECLVPNRRQAIFWTNSDPVHRRIYASLGGDELMGHLNVKNFFLEMIIAVFALNIHSCI